MDINKFLEGVVESPPEPFNGATRLVLSSDVFQALAPELDRYVANPLARPRIEVEVRSSLPAKHGMGFRPWRKGDDPEVEFVGEVLVWFLAPKGGQ